MSRKFGIWFGWAFVLAGLGISVGVMRGEQRRWVIENYGRVPARVHVRGGWTLPVTVEPGATGNAAILLDRTRMILEVTLGRNKTLVPCKIPNGPSMLHVRIEKNGKVKCRGT